MDLTLDLRWCTTRRERVWRGHADALAAFRTAGGAWPGLRSVDPDTRALAYWLRAERRRVTDPGAPSENPVAAGRRRHLDAVAPGWSGPRRTRHTFAEHAAALGQFRAAHHRFPISRPKVEGVLEESRLAVWMYAQRAVTLTNDQSQLMDRVAPGWNPTRARTFEQVWDENAEAVRAHRDVHGAWPLKDTADPAERALGIWLINQRSLAHLGHRGRGKRPSDERLAHLDQTIPGWRPAKPVRRPTWDQSLAAAAAVLASTGQLPSAGSLAEADRVLGRWLYRQLNAWRTGADPATKVGPLTEQQVADLDRATPGWRTTVTLPRARRA